MEDSKSCAETLRVLREIKANIGRNYKSKIRQAWMNGNYAGEGLREWAGQLQQMRNQFGPTWLIGVRV